MSYLSDAPYIITWTFLCSPSQKDCQRSEWQKWSKERWCGEKIKVTSYCTQEGSVWLFRSTSQARAAATASLVLPICLANIMKFHSSGRCVARNLHWRPTRKASHWYNPLKGFSCLPVRIKSPIGSQLCIFIQAMEMVLHSLIWQNMLRKTKSLWSLWNEKDRAGFKPTPDLT